MGFREVVKVFLDSIHAVELKPTVDYVCGGGEALPQPLSAEEESAALAELFAGDAESEEAKTKLIQHNLRLVVYIAKKFDNTSVEPDDLISIGTIGLIKGVNTYRNDKGAY